MGGILRCKNDENIKNKKKKNNINLDNGNENDNKIKKKESNKNHIKSKKKIYRGKGNRKETMLSMMSTNAAQLKGKLNSFKNEIIASDVAIFTVQETHFTSKGKVKIENFETFEAIRKKEKGGTIIGVHKALKPVLIVKTQRNSTQLNLTQSNSKATSLG